jgi:hypothetical protein
MAPITDPITIAIISPEVSPVERNTAAVNFFSVFSQNFHRTLLENIKDRTDNHRRASWVVLRILASAEYDGSATGVNYILINGVPTSKKNSII